MPQQDQLLASVEAVHAAGLDPELWPQALAAITRTVGGIAATLETFDRRTSRLFEFHSFGLPPPNEIAYLDHYSGLNPRIPALINGRPGNLVSDYTVLDERSMNRHPFYADFLAPAGYRYCIGGTLAVSVHEASLFSVQRSTRQGHVGKQEIATMRLLLPHVQQAFDTMRRLRAAGARDRSFKATLDWLSDGAALVRADGTLLYANQALQAIARRGDGVRIVKSRLDLATADAGARYAEALAAVGRMQHGDVRVATAATIAVQRTSDAPPYLLSIRPLFRPGKHLIGAQAEVAVFVRDPLQQHRPSIDVQREVFGLTLAEAGVARALLSGVPLVEYARQSALSLNTVYTHLRHIKEKTHTRRQAELIRTLNDLQLPLRDG